MGVYYNKAVESLTGAEKILKAKNIPFKVLQNVPETETGTQDIQQQQQAQMQQLQLQLSELMEKQQQLRTRIHN